VGWLWPDPAAPADPAVVIRFLIMGYGKNL
jgi:hypothetical protein